MTFRSITIATSLIAAAALTMGCEGDKPAPTGGGKLGGTATAKPTAAATATAAATSTASAASTAKAGAAPEGKGVLKGVIKFSGAAPEMKVPKKRADDPVCKAKPEKYNAVLVKDGKLQDVFVQIANDQIKGDFKAAKAAEVHQKDCIYSPRIQGILPEQEVAIFNDDATSHNVHSYFGSDSPFNTAQPKGADPIKTTKFAEAGVYKLQCDIHPFMRAFVVTADNPYFGVSGADGSFKIEKVPAGKFKVTAWHSQFGKLEKEVEVKDGEVSLDFEFTGKEAEPAENAGELKDLF